MPSKTASYGKLKEWFLDVYFDVCRTRGFYRKWTFEKMLLHVHEEFAENYDSPVENLMIDTIALTLAGGWFPELEGYFRKRIETRLADHPIHALLAALPGEEADDLVRDLKALEITGPTNASASSA